MIDLWIYLQNWQVVRVNQGDLGADRHSRRVRSLENGGLILLGYWQKIAENPVVLRVVRVPGLWYSRFRSVRFF